MTARRVYAADEVDAHIASLHGTLAELRAQLEAMTARAEDAERRLYISGDTESLVGRALLLAPRAADEAMLRAKDKARDLMTGSEEQARLVLADAQAQATRTTEQADAMLAPARRQAAQAEESANSLLADALRRLERLVTDARRSVDTALATRDEEVLGDVRHPHQRILDTVERLADTMQPDVPDVSVSPEAQLEAAARPEAQPVGVAPTSAGEMRATERRNLRVRTTLTERLAALLGFTSRSF